MNNGRAGPTPARPFACSRLFPQQVARPLNTLTATTEDVFAQSNGVQLITQVLPQEKTSEITCQQLASLNGGTFKNSALEGTIKNEKFQNAKKESITVLLMNPEAKE
jgi:hypothetical protein